MPFDSFMTAAITKELSEKLVGLKVDKICQPEKDEIDLIFNIKDKKRLIINCSANNPYIALSSNIKENPQVPPMMCMLLRKHLSRAKITDISQLGFDRIIKISFSAGDEMGYVKNKALYCEMMGRGSNLIFTDENDIICAAFKQNDITTKFGRIIMVGAKYTPMPLMDKLSPMDASFEDTVFLFDSADKSIKIEKFILNSFYGFGKLTARELSFSASNKNDAVLTDTDPERFYSSLCDLRNIVKNGQFSPKVLLENETNSIFDFSFEDIKQYDASISVKGCDSVSEAIESYYIGLDHLERKKQHYNDISLMLKNCKSRLEKKIALQNEQLQDSLDFEDYKIYGDLIISNIYKIKDGDEFLVTENYYDPDNKTVKIPLDPRFSASHNAQLKYKEYSKKKTAIEKMKEQIAFAEKELEYAKSVEVSMKSAKTQADLQEIREELSHWNYGRRLVSSLKKPSSKHISIGVHKMSAPSGATVLIGFNNLQNDKITFDLADKQDMWFHIKNYHGSHIVLKNDHCGVFSDEDIVFAASLAAGYSENSDMAKVEVDYTPVKYLRKPNGAKPGFVTYKQYNSITVVPYKE